MAEKDDISQRLQGGVLTALVHIAAVREPGCKALAIEFVAARRRVQEFAGAQSTPLTFRDVFAPGLSPALFKKALEHQRQVPLRRLDRLHRRELIEAIHPHDREAYATLVREAATAAATTAATSATPAAAVQRGPSAPAPSSSSAPIRSGGE